MMMLKALIACPLYLLLQRQNKTKKSVLMQRVEAARALQRTAVCVEQMHIIAADSQNVSLGVAPSMTAIQTPEHSVSVLIIFSWLQLQRAGSRRRPRAPPVGCSRSCKPDAGGVSYRFRFREINRYAIVPQKTWPFPSRSTCACMCH